MTTPTMHPSKTVSAWLALVFGSVGAHRYYLNARYWWVYPLPLALILPLLMRDPDWLISPWLLLPASIVLFSMAEAIYFALMPDGQWDTRYRPQAIIASRSGWAAVWAAILGLMLGAGLLMALLAIHIQRWVMNGAVA